MQIKAPPFEQTPKKVPGKKADVDQECDKENVEPVPSEQCKTIGKYGETSKEVKTAKRGSLKMRLSIEMSQLQ